MIEQKRDAAVFRKHLEKLKKEPWLGSSRSWWPNYLFHHSDVNNVVNILTADQLICRSEMEAKPGFLDSASPDIIGNTDKRWKDHVRFYFRPRTPTFYHIEGFRPKHRQELQAHCPVPIYLLFNLEGIICRPDSQFSFGSLAKRDTPVFSSAQDFEKLPFRLIYHDSYFSPAQRDEIIGRRQAEVIVPKQIGLEHLERIWCRSKAEYDTLHHMLGTRLWWKWKDKITDRADHSLFLRRWIYVDHVELTTSRILFYFNPCHLPADNGAFDISAKVEEIKTGQKYSCTWAAYHFTAERASGKNILGIDLSNLKYPQHYSIQLFIDNQLAYANKYEEEEDVPF